MTIGDENTPEQFLLGQLYYQALKAQGFNVSLNQSIGPTEVIQQALANGQLAMYPEYLDMWNTSVAGLQRAFGSREDAYLAGQHYALKHGLALLNATPFSDTNAIAVTFDYAVENQVQSIPDLIKVSPRAHARRPATVSAEPDRPAGAPEHLRRGSVGVQAARAGLAVPGARPGDRAGGRRPDHGS